MPNIPFFNTKKDFVGLYCSQIDFFIFLCSKTKNRKNPGQPFCRVFDLASVSVFVCVTSKLYILENIEY